MTQTDRILPGVALMIAFCIIAPLIDVSSKLAAAAVPVGIVTLGRFIVQAALMAPIVLLMRLDWRMSPRVLLLTTLRALCSIGSTYTFVAAVQAMPIADALAIAFVEPFIILLIGKLVLGEQVGLRRLGASVVGFVGALFVIQPSFAVFGPVALFPLGTAFFFALYMLITRRLSRDMHSVTMQLHTALIAAPICLPLLIAGALICAFQFWARPKVEDILAQEEAAKIAAATTPEPTPEPTGTPVVLTPEPTAEATEEPETILGIETESDGEMIGVDDDQYYR
ncbi:DMT family transporter, partial [Candidatus Falkowbacteria bacterium]|nr:DMT family transporter [Candidatus Falkowbacteria bacterium]